MGLELEKEGEGFNVANLAFNGMAEKAKVEFGDIVTLVDVEQTGRPPKEVVYPIALAVLAALLGWQWMRRGRRPSTEQPAG